MTTTTATPELIEANKRWLQLQALDEQAREARERVAGLEAKVREAQRTIERTTGELADYHQAVGAGSRERDPELEAKLAAAAREARSSVTIRPRARLGGGGGVDISDEGAEAELAGARAAVEAADRAVAAHLARHVGGLAGELWPRAVEARDQFEERWGELKAAEAEWLDVTRAFARIAEAARVPLEEVPGTPLRGLGAAIDRDGVPLPVPDALKPREDGS